MATAVVVDTRRAGRVRWRGRQDRHSAQSDRQVLDSHRARPGSARDRAIGGELRREEVRREKQSK